MNDPATPDNTLAAVCGLFCPACRTYIVNRESPETLPEFAARFGRSAEDMTCNGCRSDTLCFYCREHCFMKGCAEKRGHDFCVECVEYPCAELKEFQSLRPHRLELWRSQERIGEVGWEQWYSEMVAHYSCPECGTVNSAYDSSCRRCGATPSCEYVREHRAELDDFAERERKEE